MTAREIIEAEDPKAFFRRGMLRKWRVEFTKRQGRPLERTAYNIEAATEEEAVEKGWARLQEQVPQRWRLFGLYSVNKA